MTVTTVERRPAEPVGDQSFVRMDTARALDRATLAHGATKYQIWVDKDGRYGAPDDGRTRASQSQLAPLATISRALAVAQDGDVIMVVQAATAYPAVTLAEIGPVPVGQASDFNDALGVTARAGLGPATEGSEAQPITAARYIGSGLGAPLPWLFDRLPTPTYTAGQAADVSAAQPIAATFGSPSVAQFSESFDGTTLDAAKWVTRSGDYSVTGGELAYALTRSGSIMTDFLYTLTGSAIVVEVTSAEQMANGAVQSWRIQTAADNSYVFEVSTANGFRCFERSEAGVFDTTVIAADWDPVAHRFMRVRESAGTVHWDVSPDRVNWTTVKSKAPSNSTSAMFRVLFAVTAATSPTSVFGIAGVNAHDTVTVGVGQAATEDAAQTVSTGAGSAILVRSALEDSVAHRLLRGTIELRGHVPGDPAGRVAVTRLALEGATNWKLANLVTANAGDGSNGEQELSQFRNCGVVECSNVHFRGAGLAIRGGGPYTFTRCIWSGSAAAAPIAAWQDRGVYATDDTELLADCTWTRCTFRDMNGSGGLVVETAGPHPAVVTVEDCLAHSMRQVDPLHLTVALRLSHGGPTIVRRSEFRECAGAIRLDATVPTPGAATIENSLAYDPAGGQPQVAVLADAAPGLRLINNTILGDVAMWANADCRVQNNIIETFDGSGSYDRDLNDHRANLIGAAIGGMTLGPTDTAGSPTFEATTLTAFDLAPGTAGHDAGAVDPVVPATDRLGRPRIGVPDVGCHERQAGAPTVLHRRATDSGAITEAAVVDPDAPPAPTLWVDNLTGNDTLARELVTELEPLRTISRAVALAQPGDRIAVVATGAAYDALDLTMDVDASVRNPSAPIEIVGWGGMVEVPHMAIRSASAWTFARFTITDHFDAISVGGTCADLTWQQCVTLNGGANLSASNYLAGTFTGTWLIEDCDFTATRADESDFHWFDWRGLRWAPDAGTAAQLTVRGCAFHDLGGDCAIESVDGGSLTIEDCEFADLQQLVNARAWRNVAVRASGHAALTVRRCRFTDVAAALSLTNAPGALIENCLLAGVGADMQIVGCPGATIRHCTAVDRAWILGAGSTGCTLANSIGGHALSGGSLAVNVGNLTPGAVTFLGTGMDPYELAAGSAGINAADAAHAAADDLLRRTRGSAPDVGCYERQG